MKVSSDVLQLATILEETGFGWMAGEIVSEISLGRCRTSDDPTLDEQERDPIPDDEQLSVAIDMVISRLVAPARAFSAAERYCARLHKGAPSKIVFVDPAGEIVEALSCRAPPGTHRVADKLENVLRSLLEPPITPVPVVI